MQARSATARARGGEVLKGRSVALLPVLLLAPGLALAQAANGPAAQPCPPELPGNAQPAETMVLPLELLESRGLLLVRVTVNGKPGRLVLDTGAGQTTISWRLAGVSQKEFVRATQAERQAASTHTWVTVPGRLTLGIGAHAERRVVQIADFDETSRLAEATIDGVLGTDVLGEFGHVAIDLQARTLTLRKTAPLSTRREKSQ